MGRRFLLAPMMVNWEDIEIFHICWGFLRTIIAKKGRVLRCFYPISIYFPFPNVFTVEMIEIPQNHTTSRWI